jgi:hypothetical protein
MPTDLLTCYRVSSLREQGQDRQLLLQSWAFNGVESASMEVGPAVIYRGLFQGVAVTFLVDSGAQVNLVSQRFCEDNPHLRVFEDSIRLHFGIGADARRLLRAREESDLRAGGVGVAEQCELVNGAFRKSGTQAEEPFHLLAHSRW